MKCRVILFSFAIMFLLLVNVPMLYTAIADDVPFTKRDNLQPLAQAPNADPPPVGNIILTPDSITLAPGDISPVGGSATKTFTKEYAAFGIVFGTNNAGDNVPTAIFTDPPHAWGGVNGLGIVDLLAPVVGYIVIPGTNNPGTTSFLRVEAGYASVGSLLLEVFDGNGKLLGSTFNDDGVGSYGRTLLILSIAGIRSFRISATAQDNYGVDEIQIGNPEPVLTLPVGGVVLPTNKTEILAPFLAIAGIIAAISTVELVVRRRKD